MLLIHIISHRKTIDQIAIAPRKSKQAVLAIDLRSYLQRWWSTCDPAQAETIKEAVTATAAMRAWLRAPDNGKTWIANPEFVQEREKLRGWIRVLKQRQQDLVQISVAPALQKLEVTKDEKSRRDVVSRPRIPDAPDQDLGPSEGVCIRCGGGLRLINVGSGMFKGRKVIQCSRDLKHPMKIL